MAFGVACRTRGSEQLACPAAARRISTGELWG
jgi:hypothetical protein